MKLPACPSMILTCTRTCTDTHPCTMLIICMAGAAAEMVSLLIVCLTGDSILVVKAKFSGTFTAKLSAIGEMMPLLGFWLLKFDECRAKRGKNKSVS